MAPRKRPDLTPTPTTEDSATKERAYSPDEEPKVRGDRVHVVVLREGCGVQLEMPGMKDRVYLNDARIEGYRYGDRVYLYGTQTAEKMETAMRKARVDFRAGKPLVLPLSSFTAVW